MLLWVNTPYVNSNSSSDVQIISLPYLVHSYSLCIRQFVHPFPPLNRSEPPLVHPPHNSFRSDSTAKHRPSHVHFSITWYHTSAREPSPIGQVCAEYGVGIIMEEPKMTRVETVRSERKLLFSASLTGTWGGPLHPEMPLYFYHTWDCPEPRAQERHVGSGARTNGTRTTSGSFVGLEGSRGRRWRFQAS